MKLLRLLPLFSVLALHGAPVAGNQTPVSQAPAGHHATVVEVYDIASGEAAWRAGVSTSPVAAGKGAGVALIFDFSPSVTWDRLAADLYTGEQRLNKNQLVL